MEGEPFTIPPLKGRHLHDWAYRFFIREGLGALIPEHGVGSDYNARK
jgi:hypothetical protein